MAGANKALKGLPWVDQDSVKVNYDAQNARFHVPDMAQFNQDELLKALPGKNVVVEDVKKQ